MVKQPDPVKHSKYESEEEGSSDAETDDTGHTHVISKGNIKKKIFITGPTLYTDISFDVSGKDTKVCATENHDGEDTESSLGTTLSAEKPFESKVYKGEDTTAIDGIISSGVDDKVGTVETAQVTRHSCDYKETKYGDTCAGPNLDEETGTGVYYPDAEKPGRDRVHITDGGDSGDSEHENPNVVVVKTYTKGASAYIGHVKGKTTNVSCSVAEPQNTTFEVEIFEQIEGHQGPHYSSGTESCREEVKSSHTTCDYD